MLKLLHDFFWMWLWTGSFVGNWSDLEQWCKMNIIRSKLDVAAHVGVSMRYLSLSLIQIKNSPLIQINHPLAPSHPNLLAYHMRDPNLLGEIRHLSPTASILEYMVGLKLKNRINLKSPCSLYKGTTSLIKFTEGA